MSIDLSFESDWRVERERGGTALRSSCRAESGHCEGRDGHLCLIVRLFSPLLPASVAHNQQQAEQRPSDLDWVRMVGGGGGGGRREGRKRKEGGRLFHSTRKQRQRAGGVRRRKEALVEGGGGGVWWWWWSVVVVVGE